MNSSRLLSLLTLLLQADFVHGMAAFLAEANMPHSPRQIGETVASAVFFFVLQWWNQRQLKLHASTAATTAVKQELAAVSGTGLASPPFEGSASAPDVVSQSPLPNIPPFQQ